MYIGNITGSPATRGTDKYDCTGTLVQADAIPPGTGDNTTGLSGYATNIYTVGNTIYFNSNGKLSNKVAATDQKTIVDSGREKNISKIISSPNKFNDDRLVFLSSTLKDQRLLSGTPNVTLDLSVLNRRAANITIVIVEYLSNGSNKIITRGWADPQNFKNISSGELLDPDKRYKFSFDLEPKQYLISKGSKIGVVLTSTDYHYTIRPKSGTKIQFNLGENTYIKLNLSTASN